LADFACQTDLDDCAEAYISAAKNTSMTGQQIVVGKLKSLAIVIVTDITDAGLAIK